MILFFVGIVIFYFILAVNYSNRKKRRMNNYIELHKQKQKNDNDYEAYEKWCFKVGEIPMAKKTFLADVEKKENQYKKLIK